MSDIKILKAGQTGFNELNVVYIYTLVDPLTNLVRYIGKANNIDIRLKEHIRKSKYSKTYKNNWINSLLKEGFEPIIKVIDVVSNDDWGFWEQFWIDQFKIWGFNLTNIANGGVGGNLGPIVNQKISISLKGRACTDETKDKLRDFRLGKTYNELYGLEKSINIKNKMSNTRVGINNSMYGKKHTNETKDKISKKLSDNNKGENNPMYGKKHTDETKDKIRKKVSQLTNGENNPMYGKKHTEEAKKKIRKKVMQISLDDKLIKVWGSITEAAKELNATQSGISNVCDKDNKTYYNYKWKKCN
jgi:group I intron endonuclease